VMLFIPKQHNRVEEPSQSRWSSQHKCLWASHWVVTTVFRAMEKPDDCHGSSIHKV
jgi:hypothetical protein